MAQVPKELHALRIVKVDAAGNTFKVDLTGQLVRCKDRDVVSIVASYKPDGTNECPEHRGWLSVIHLSVDEVSIPRAFERRMSRTMVGEYTNAPHFTDALAGILCRSGVCSSKLVGDMRVLHNGHDICSRQTADSPFGQAWQDIDSNPS